MPSHMLRISFELQKYLELRYPGRTDLLHWVSPTHSPFPLRIPQFYADLIDWEDANDPLAKMVVPNPAEENPHTYELADPIADAEHEPVPGLIHRYPDRCLLLLTTYCAVHCRFCFRREVVGHVRPVELKKIQQYLQEHTEVRELVFSGGDPGTYPPAFLHSLSQHLAGCSHISVWRFHTRVPAVDPLSVTKDWIAAVQNAPAKQKVVVTHINHGREVTPEFAVLMRQLQAAQITTLSQSVLLKGVNDSHQELIRLFRALAETGVKPYYLHHLDKALGTHHFRLSIVEGQRLFKSLRDQLAGWMIPEYVVELAHGSGKFPVMQLEDMGDGMYLARSFDGKQVTYQDPLFAAGEG